MSAEDHCEILHGHHFRALLGLHIHLPKRSQHATKSANRKRAAGCARRRETTGGGGGAHGVLDGVRGDDGGVVVRGVRGEAVGDDADGDVPFDEDVAAGSGGAAPDARDADAGLAVPALELEAVGHGVIDQRGPDSRSGVVCAVRRDACEKCTMVLFVGGSRPRIIRRGGK